VFHFHVIDYAGQRSLGCHPLVEHLLVAFLTLTFHLPTSNNGTNDRHSTLAPRSRHCTFRGSCPSSDSSRPSRNGNIPFNAARLSHRVPRPHPCILDTRRRLFHNATRTKSAQGGQSPPNGMGWLRRCAVRDEAEGIERRGGMEEVAFALGTIGRGSAWTDDDGEGRIRV
jgi:hypothetical protein